MEDTEAAFADAERRLQGSECSYGKKSQDVRRKEVNALR